MQIRTNYLLIAISLIALGATIFQSVKVKNLNAQIDQIQDESVSRMANEPFIHALNISDSLLATGKYAEAMTILDSMDRTSDEVEFRWKIASEMKTLANKRVGAQIIEKTITDTVEKILITPIIKEIEPNDSLLTELTHSQELVQELKAQIEEVSSGTYITFQTSKGTPLHYVGESKEQKANGQGVAILETGSRYEGEWKDNMRHGEGKFYWADGEWYEGHYENDRKSGLGTYYWLNGDKYVGQWKDDQRNGHGAFYNKKGKLIASGLWENDELIKKDKKHKK